MLDKIIALDKTLFVYLNGLGSPQFDGLWLIITKQAYWIPFFLFLAYLIYKKLGWKQLLIIMLFVALLLLCCNTSVEFFKATFHRLRPCNDPELKNTIRIIHQSDSYSFFSGHAANSMATMTFLYLMLKKQYKYIVLIFLYPLIFAYSRIYLGVHFPTDILTGYAFGILFGVSFYYINKKFILKS
ncbi:phosphatase PAP2 family protein [Flavobacterium aciduliphilum]|uniref:Undecaprenyl-diphosphatase n=1 Tax=Flavobacterium aciduliphilum TaxID=1101402 RepID=A0A328YFK7_9FLAO|nr:phosphatase PAP2 family protein [Flavobacterium aciduliphilum]RAR71455.1 undecaprenyl-diphosphatase [Flavobacterium aciduliphilum]